MLVLAGALARMAFGAGLRIVSAKDATACDMIRTLQLTLEMTKVKKPSALTYPHLPNIHFPTICKTRQAD
jgi:hypothetical protein